MKLRFIFSFFSFIGFFSLANAQCMMVPLPFNNRVDASTFIVLGKYKSQHSYWNQAHTNIFTAYTVEVMAYLKGFNKNSEIVVISEGGQVGFELQETLPSVQLSSEQEFIIMLEKDEQEDDDKQLRLQHPSLIQAKAHACNQGLFLKNAQGYRDYFSKSFLREDELIQKIVSVSGCNPIHANGKKFYARQQQQSTNNVQAKISAIGSFTPTTTNAGTIVPGDFITITGSGFGAAAGTVFFSNADDGGATFTSSGIATDNVAWADGSITVKVASGAGTGPINVNGIFTSASNLTITYSHQVVNSTFSGFASNTRQRFYHRNMNGAGGMYFLYNTTSGFSTNAPAVAAFERALESWRCGTFINWYSNGTTASVFADDNVNVVMFDGTLPAGVLGRATSRRQASATGACNLANTVWCVEEIDIQFKPDPPVVGFPWEYGPAAPAFSEYDFESVALHELGHGHGLGHIINAGKVMHYSLSNGSTARVLDASTDIAGGNARMAYSTAATCLNPAACGTGPMTALTAGTCVLPFDLLDFSGQYDEKSEVHLEWVSDMFSTTTFSLFKSIDGINFESIYTFNDEGRTSSKLFEYHDIVENDFNGAYYKIEKQREKNINSKIIYVSALNKNNYSVYHTQNNIVIQVAKNNGPLDFTLYDAQGKKMYLKTINSNYVTLNAPDASGIYFYTIADAGGGYQGKLYIK